MVPVGPVAGGAALSIAEQLRRSRPAGLLGSAGGWPNAESAIGVGIMQSRRIDADSIVVFSLATLAASGCPELVEHCTHS